MSNYAKIFHTVPLVGQEMIRAADGKDKIGFKFPKDGWTPYVTNKNTEETPLLAAIALKDFVGLDFDTDESFNKALSIDPDCKYVAKSDSKGGHLLYRYNDVYGFTASVKVRGILDLQVGNTLIYLATPANKTKTLLTPEIQSLDDLSYMPVAMQLYVENIILKYKYNNVLYSDDNKSFAINDTSTLGYLLDKIEPDSPYNESIFKLLTPKMWKNNVIHPNDVPDGEGTSYLQAIRTRLALDTSISEEVFRKTMHYINNQWDDPMPASKVNSDCDYQINKATIDGHKAWVYDAEWHKKGLIVKDKHSSAIEFFYDADTAKFLEFNRTTKNITIHQTMSNAKNSIVSKSKKPISANEMLAKSNEVSKMSDPTKVSYYTAAKAPYTATFNTFVPARGTMILRDPALISEPRHPTSIIKFLENLIPNRHRLEWFLQFIRHKHLYYDYSPIYIVFAGVGGAGKGVLVNIILQYFAGLERIQDIDLEKLQNNFNAWKAATDYAHLDEAGEGMTRRETALIVAELKKLTGSPMASITYKGKDVSGKDNVKHYITPILNTNLDVKVITDLPKNDRRFVFIKCPNKMAKVSDNNDAQMVEQIKEELPYFAYYLSTQVKPISIKDYTSNEGQKDEDYYEFMKATVDPMHQLVEAVEECNIEKFIYILQEDYFISNDKISKLFDERINVKEGRCIIYNTPATTGFNAYSLYDLALETEAMDVNIIKKLFGSYKKASTYMHPERKSLIYKYNYLYFHKPYVSKEMLENKLDETIEDVEL